MTAIHKSGSLHQAWKSKAIEIVFEEIHKNELRFTFSRMLWISITSLVKTQLFLSFQIAQVEASQITLKYYLIFKKV